MPWKIYWGLFLYSWKAGLSKMHNYKIYTIMKIFYYWGEKPAVYTAVYFSETEYPALFAQDRLP